MKQQELVILKVIKCLKLELFCLFIIKLLPTL